MNNYELVDTLNITFNEKDIMIVNREEVEEIFELVNLVKFLKEHPRLWRSSKLLLQNKQYTSRSSAPIISIAFDKAINIIINDKKVKTKSLFRLDKEYSENEIGGTLFADFRRDENEINFQLWQIYHINNDYIKIPTYFIHGIYDIKKEYFIHFDGALINHNKEFRVNIENGIIPLKEDGYYKTFRLDGIITKDEANQMMSVYLPIKELNDEFGIINYKEIKNGEGNNMEESYYLCEGIWFDKELNKLIDEKNGDETLDIDTFDDKIIIFEREVKEWLFHPMILLLKDDLENKSNYKPFKNSIFILFGIFSYIEKLQRYKDGKPYKSGDTESTKILTLGFKNIFMNNKNKEYGNSKISNILESTRHSMMHTGNIGDYVLLNSDYENSNAVEYIVSNKILEKIEINPKKMLTDIENDFNNYLLKLRNNDKICIDNFKKVFDDIYNEEIKELKT